MQGRGDARRESRRSRLQLQAAAAGYKDFGHCDAGVVSENFTEAFVRLLVDWKDVDGAAAANQDPGFHAFMEKHLKDSRPRRTTSKASTRAPRRAARRSTKPSARSSSRSLKAASEKGK